MTVGFHLAKWAIFREGREPKLSYSYCEMFSPATSIEAQEKVVFVQMEKRCAASTAGERIKAECSAGLSVDRGRRVAPAGF
jgi:hypothetical protein